MIETRKIFKSAEELAEALAQDVASWLQASIAHKDFAVLAVSGGSTPKPFFAALSMREIEWSKVQITLVDERQVPEDNAHW
jgi:6-phosphogluconolactonase